MGRDTEKPKRGKWIDAMWKSILLDCVEDAILFFLPELAEARDTSQPIGFAQEELAKIDGGGQGARVVDVAFVVPLPGGREHRVVCIIEQQHERDADFGRRMFVEYYRMSDRMEIPVTSPAIFTGRAQSAARYDTGCFGTRLAFEYNSCAVAAADIEALKADKRVFAMVILAAKRMLDAGGDPRKRAEYARELLGIMRERDYSREKKRNILGFVEQALRLADEDIDMETKEEWNMITIPVKEAAEQFRLHNAFEEGMEKGLQKGKAEMAQSLVAAGVPAEVIAKSAGLSLDEVLSLKSKN